MNIDYHSKAHSKFLLIFHLILVCKYRKKLLSDTKISNSIKQLSETICTRHNTHILKMETDKDHIHYMLEIIPNTNLANLVKTIKSYTTFHIWKLFRQKLLKEFWKEHTFWTDGYFLTSIGNVSQAVLETYIENQG